MSKKHNNGVEQVATILNGLFTSGAATDLLRAYYCYEQNGSKVYSGALFDTARSASTWNANAITEADLLSLSLLSVPVSGNLVRDLRSGFFDKELPEYGKSLNDLVAAMPAEIKFEDSLEDQAFSAHYVEGAAAWTAWEALRLCNEDQKWKFGQTRRSKLLALKRPLLVPIYDDVVAKLFGRESSKEHWNDTRALLMIPGTRQGTESALELLGDSIPEISVIRALDVILWMYGQERKAMPESGPNYEVQRVATV